MAVSFAYYTVLGGVVAGGIFGAIVEGIRRRRAAVRPGLDGTSWIGIVEAKHPSGTKTTTGIAFLGATCFLVAVKGGARHLVRREEIRALRRVSEKRVEMSVELDARPVKLYLVGPRANEAAELMVGGK
jgi:hypothetical protein